MALFTKIKFVAGCYIPAMSKWAEAIKRMKKGGGGGEGGYTPEVKLKENSRNSRWNIYCSCKHDFYSLIKLNDPLYCNQPHDVWCATLEIPYT